MPPPLLKASNGYIRRASDDEPIALRGAHLFYLTHKFHDSDAPAIEQAWAETVIKPVAEGGWGANLLTFWVETDPALGLTSGDYTSTMVARWRDHLDALVALCNDYGAYLLLSWHNNSGWQGHTKIIDTDGRAAMAWAAARYSGNSSVFFAVQAEPPDADDGGTDSWSTLKAACEQTIDEIRAEYPSAMVGIPGLIWSQDVSDHVNDMPNRSNLFSKPHLYDKMPDGLTASNRQSKQVMDAGVPLIYGEFGPRSDSSLMQLSDAEELIDYCEEQEPGQAGWQAWALTPEGSPTMLGSTSISDLTSWGEVVKVASETYSESESDESVEPEPEPESEPVAPPTGLTLFQIAPPEYEVWVLDRGRRKRVVIDDYEHVSWTRRWQGEDTITLLVSPISRALPYLYEGSFLQIIWRMTSDRPWQEEYTGVIEHEEYNLTERKEIREFRARDVCGRRIILPPHVTGADPTQAQEVYNNVPGETAMKGFITNHTVAPTNPKRRIPGATVEEDLGRGEIVSVNARFQNMVDKLHEVALAARIGWEWIGTATGLEFRIIEGVDRTIDQKLLPPVVFAPDFDNIESLQYVSSILSRATTAYVGGQGEGVDRVIVNTHSAAGFESISAFSALALEGERSWVKFPSDVSVRGLQQVTLEGWLYIGAEGDSIPVWHESISGQIWSRFRLAMWPDRRAHLTMRPHADGPDGSLSFTASPSVPQELWAHIAVRCDLSNGEISIKTFVPGGQAEEGFDMENPDIDVTDTFSTDTGRFLDKSPNWIGMGYREDTKEHSKIRIAEWRLWSSIRSDADIADNRLNQIVEPDLLSDLIGYYRYDDASGTIARDASGRHNDGEIQGVSKWVEGPVVIEETPGVDTGPEGLQRRETFVDARDLEEVGDALRDRGRAKLREQGPKARLEGQIMLGPSRYREDWDLGDLVSVRNIDWGIIANVRVVEVEVALESDKTPSIRVSFAAPWPDFADYVTRDARKTDAALNI